MSQQRSLFVWPLAVDGTWPVLRNRCERAYLGERQGQGGQRTMQAGQLSWQKCFISLLSNTWRGPCEKHLHVLSGSAWVRLDAHARQRPSKTTKPKCFLVTAACKLLHSSELFFLTLVYFSVLRMAAPAAFSVFPVQFCSRSLKHTKWRRPGWSLLTQFVPQLTSSTVLLGRGFLHQ